MYGFIWMRQVLHGTISWITISKCCQIINIETSTVCYKDYADVIRRIACLTGDINAYCTNSCCVKSCWMSLIKPTWIVCTTIAGTTVIGNNSCIIWVWCICGTLVWYTIRNCCEEKYDSLFWENNAKGLLHDGAFVIVSFDDVVKCIK
jgi:hypothetical protein